MILSAQQLKEMLRLPRRCIADEERCVCSQAVSMLGGQLALQEGGGSCGVAMTSRNQFVSSSRPGLQAGRCSRQTSKSRREQRFSMSLRLLALALVLIVGQSEGASLRSNVLELEDDHESLLTRAKDLFTDAVHDAANAVKPAAKRWSNQKVRMLRITEAQAPSGGSILALVVPLKGLSCDDEQACFTATPQYLAIGLQMVFLCGRACYGRLTFSLCNRSACMRARSLRQAACPPGSQARPWSARRTAGSCRATGACCAGRRRTTTLWRTSGSSATEGACYRPQAILRLCVIEVLCWERGAYYADVLLERHSVINVGFVRRYVEELEGNEASTSAWDVLFYGDSIMEEWR